MTLIMDDKNKKECYKDLGIYYLSGVIDESSTRGCVEYILDENIK